VLQRNNGYGSTGNPPYSNGFRPPPAAEAVGAMIAPIVGMPQGIVDTATSARFYETRSVKRFGLKKRRQT
jgi:hypothetical protein